MYDVSNRLRALQMIYDIKLIPIWYDSILAGKVSTLEDRLDDVVIDIDDYQDEILVEEILDNSLAAKKELIICGFDKKKNCDEKCKFFDSCTRKKVDICEKRGG